MSCCPQEQGPRGSEGLASPTMNSLEVWRPAPQFIVSILSQSSDHCVPTADLDAASPLSSSP